jgi:hypothetical protein
MIESFTEPPQPQGEMLRRLQTSGSLTSPASLLALWFWSSGSGSISSTTTDALSRARRARQSLCPTPQRRMLSFGSRPRINWSLCRASRRPQLQSWKIESERNSNLLSPQNTRTTRNKTQDKDRRPTTSKEQRAPCTARHAPCSSICIPKSAIRNPMCPLLGRGCPRTGHTKAHPPVCKLTNP